MEKLLFGEITNLKKIGTTLMDTPIVEVTVKTEIDGPRLRELILGMGCQINYNGEMKNHD